jgi:hypothetical protein
MELLIDNNKVSSEQNAEGMYNVMIVQRDKRKFRTGFIFDSIELIGEKALLVSQTDSDGNKKFGLITAGFYTRYFPCIFDDVKLYKSKRDHDMLQVFIGNEDYYIRESGEVYSKEFLEIRRL